MKEHPTLFNGPMVRATLERRKSQTRRVIKPQPTVPDWFEWRCEEGLWRPYDDLGNWLPAYGQWRSPYGVPGDLLVPLTTWAVHRMYDHVKPTQLPRDLDFVWTAWLLGGKPDVFGKLRPGRFLPKQFRHLLPRLENEETRVERVQEISEEDTIAEGLVARKTIGGHDGYGLPEWPVEYVRQSPIDAFEFLWDSISAKQGFGWKENPRVWVTGFKVAEVKR